MKKFFVIALILLASGIGIGAGIHESIYRTRDIHVVREVYTVKAGDTLWDIAFRYQTKDCRNLYLPEFKDEIERLNPFLYKRNGAVKEGDKLIIEYMIRK